MIPYLALAPHASPEGEVEDDPGDGEGAEQGWVGQTEAVRDVVVRAGLEHTVREELLCRGHDALSVTKWVIVPVDIFHSGGN